MRAGGWPVIALWVLLWPSPLAASEISGPARVVDGDTLVIAGERIRLHGIDAPEKKQVCLNADGIPWPCGAAALLALAARIGADPVICSGEKHDRYRRLVAVCLLKGLDLGAWMVAQGWALAYRQYSHAYVTQERAAQVAMRGLWSGRFIAPWTWRRRGRA